MNHSAILTLAEFKELVTKIYALFGEQFLDAVLEYSCRLYKEVGGSLHTSKMYHILIGSTPDLTLADEIDHQRDRSIQQFVYDFLHQSQHA